MPQKPAPGPIIEAENKRITYYFGTFPRRVSKASGGTEIRTVNLLMTARAKVGEVMNFKEPTDAQSVNTIGDKKANVFGAWHGKTIICDHPLGTKTPKGATQTVSFQVPSGAKVPEIKAFLRAGGKVKTFRIKGGRSYTVGAA